VKGSLPAAQSHLASARDDMLLVVRQIVFSIFLDLQWKSPESGGMWLRSGGLKRRLSLPRVGDEMLLVVRRIHQPISTFCMKFSFPVSLICTGNEETLLLVRWILPNFNIWHQIVFSSFLDLHWKSPEFGGVWHESGGLRRAFDGWWNAGPLI